MDESLQLLPTEFVGLLGNYASLLPPKGMDFPSHIPFLTIHSFLLEHILLNPHFQAYPASTQYQLSFWKWAICHLEAALTSEDDEIDQRIYDHYLFLMPLSSRSQAIGECPPAPSFVTHIWNDGFKYHSGTLLESRTTIERGTTGFKTWPASLVLADYLLAHPELVSHRNVLELGSGAGLLGIVVGFLQSSSGGPMDEGIQSSLLLTDGREDVLRRCQDNLALSCNESSLHPRLKYHPLDWTDALDASRRPRVSALCSAADIDTILGADVVYDPSIVLAIVATLLVALGPTKQLRRKSALIALTVRNPETIAAFLQVARNSLVVKEIATDLNHSSFCRLYRKGAPFNDEVIRIYELTYPDKREQDTK